MDASLLLVEDDPSIREVTAIGLRNAGFDGFLIGEHFMKAENPGAAFQSFTQKLASL